MVADRILIRQQAELLAQLVRRDVAERYRGSMLGLGWALLLPLSMLAVYSLVFGLVFKQRFPSMDGLETDSVWMFPLMLYAGLLVHAMLAEVLQKATIAVVRQPNLVKKVVFPLGLLPMTVVCGALVNMLPGLGMLLVGAAAVSGFKVSMLLVPVILVPFVAFCFGTAWVLASLGVYLRDLSQIMGVLASMLLFLSPVFYPISAVPEWLQCGLLFNPLTLVIEALRAAIFGDALPSVMQMSMYCVAAFVWMLAGRWWFARTHRGFADVL